MQTPSDKKVILQEPVLAHYRKDVFNILVSGSEMQLQIVAGKNFEGIRGIEDNRYKTFSFVAFGLPGHRFYYLKGAVKYILSERPAAIICTGVDFHQLHTLLLFLIHRLIYRKKFFWWSHATPGKQGIAGRLARKFFYRNASGILAYSQKGKQTLVKMGIRSGNICVVNNSLNKIDYGFLNTNILRTGLTEPLRIIFVGRITPAKRLDLLIAALTQLSREKSFSFECEIIGGGDASEYLQEVKKQGLENKIRFTGAVYEVQLKDHLLRADLMVYPGGIGLSIVQALSYGIPVITTDREELQMPEIELLIPGRNGDFFKHESVTDLVDKIVTWKQKLEQSRNAIVDACVQSIKEKGYLPEIVAGNAIKFLTEKLNNP